MRARPANEENARHLDEVRAQEREQKRAAAAPPRSASTQRTRCSEHADCQYPPDPKRSDGRCTWGGEEADYRATGDRSKLHNRGVCTEERKGQLCTLGQHHADCTLGQEAQRRTLARIEASKRKPTTHEAALGIGGAQDAA